MMEGEDFTMPSPKRQRTNSAEKLPNPALTPAEPNNQSLAASSVTLEDKNDTEGKVNGSVVDHNEILDTLMQHVEAEATPNVTSEDSTSIPIPFDTSANAEATEPHVGESTQAKITANGAADHVRIQDTLDATPVEEVVKSSITVEEQISKSEAQVQDGDASSDCGHPRVEITDSERASQQIDGIPATEVIEPAEGGDQPEWEVDSSPYESSTDSDSTDSSDEDSDDDNDEDADGDYAMLDPEEAARMLMQGDLGSDDEGDKSKAKGEGSALRTANEVAEDIPLIPDITLTDSMRIEELGSVEAIVENNVLIKGKVSGEYQVLESGSLLCLQNRSIAGVVAETLGRVEQPLYTVRLRDEQDIKQRGLFEKGTVVYYVPQHSSFVFTQPLKAFKGSDASNFHDEEVGDDEMEFSDDEAEAEHKRQLKLKRQGRPGDTGRGRGAGRGGRGGQRGGGHKPSPLSTDTNSAAYSNGSMEMNYDDVEEGEEGYTPLARPSNLYEMASQNPTLPTIDTTNLSHMPPPPFPDRGRGRGRGPHRGRGQDRSGRGGRGNFRGGQQHNNRGGSYQPHGQSPTQYYPLSPGAFLPGQYPYTQPPPAPSLAPQNPSYPYSTITSPISPLPKQQFNFNAGFHQSPNVHSPIFQQQQQQQQQWAQQLPGGFQFNNQAMAQFAQQFQQGPPPPLPQMQQPQMQHDGWQVNQAAAAEVQRQLEEMRRAQGGG